MTSILSSGINQSFTNIKQRISIICTVLNMLDFKSQSTLIELIFESLLKIFYIITLHIIKEILGIGKHSTY